MGRVSSALKPWNLKPWPAFLVVFLAAGAAGAKAQDWQPDSTPSAAAPSAKKKVRDDYVAPGQDSRPYLRPMDVPPDAYSNQPARRAPVGQELPPYDQSQPYGTPYDAPSSGGKGWGKADKANKPSKSGGGVQREAIPPPVEKGDLTPVMAGDGSGLPYEMWRGLDAAGLEKLVASLEIPPRSPTLHALWKRLITSTVAGDAPSADFTALRLEMLYRSGLARDAAEIANKAATGDALLMTLAARNELASGEPEKACKTVASVASQKGSTIPPRLKGQTILMAGFCAAAQNDNASAGLSAELAREEGVEPSPGLDALDALAIGSKPKFSAVKQITLLDYKIAQKVGGLPAKLVLEKGEPALLASLATDHTTSIDLGLPATEAAARLNALPPDQLAAIYRVNAEQVPADTLLSGGGPKGVFRRAALFKAAEAEETPMRKTRLIRAFLDEAKRERLSVIAAEMIAPETAELRPAPELSWFSETAVEIALAAGRYDMARAWLAVSGDGQLDYWRALIDVADPNEPARGKSLPLLEHYVGRFSPPALQRLATVLEALDYLVPIPLWEAANRTPQINTGYLPETGVLSELQDAAKKQEFGRTVLLVMKAMGPNGAETAHLIALGDSIRALRKANLDSDARRLGVEALLSDWPRSATN